MFAGMLREVMEGRGVIARAKGLRHVLPAPLLTSVLGHGLLVAIVSLGLSWRGVEEQRAGQTLISVDMIFPAAVPAATSPEPEPLRSSLPRALKTRSKPTGPVADDTASEEIWRPLDPRVERARAVQQLIDLAACPHFDEPAGRAMDPDLAEKCARTLEGTRTGPGAALVAVRVARQQERHALKLGWAVAVVPEFDPDAPEAQTSPHKTYAEEAFGPWPWDAARHDGG